MSSKHSSKSKGKEPAHKSHGSSSTKSQAGHAAVNPSFLFCVNELPTNNDPIVDGAYMRCSEVKRWIPPNQPGGFGIPRTGDVYLWKDGSIRAAEGYEYSQDAFTNVKPNGAIFKALDSGLFGYPELYSAATVFYCGDFEQFWAARGFANRRDMVSYSCEPEDMWQALNFWRNYSTGISCAQLAGDERLSIPRDDWLLQLVPDAYHARHGEVRGHGFAGLLSLLVALAAFSCEDRRAFKKILLEDNCWKNYKWRRHQRSHGRRDGRGLIVNIYLDPDNESGSTGEILRRFEDGDLSVFG